MGGGVDMGCIVVEELGGIVVVLGVGVGGVGD